MALLASFKGELAALLAAFLWSVSAAIYARTGARVPVLELNVLKGAIAIGAIALTRTIAASVRPELAPLPTGLLLLSGAIGIGLGDTAFLAALKTLGSRRTLLLETLAPPLTAILGALILSERLPATAWGAIALTLAGIAWVVSEGTTTTVAAAAVSPAGPQSGLVWAILAAVAQASGATLSRAALRNSDIEPSWSALLRLLAGTLCALLLLLWARRSPPLAILTFSPRGPARWQALGAVVLAALLGTYLGIWLQQTSFKFAPAGIAQTLSATSPLFILPIAALGGDYIGSRAILGAAIAIAGVALLLLAAT